MHQLQRSVGLGGVNRIDDVLEAQRGLLAAGYPPGPIDGRCGRLTISAIVRLQRGFLHQPDGRIDVQGPTWHHLSSAVPKPAAHAAHVAPASKPAGAAASSPPATAARPATVTPHPLTVPRPAAAPHPSPKPHPAPVTAHPAPAQASPAVLPVANRTTLHYTDHLPVPPRAKLNHGVRFASNALLVSKLGMPRKDFTQDDQPVTNPGLLKMITTESVGPFRVTGLRPAIESLRAIFADVRRDHPDLYGLLHTAGMMCCRNVRGSKKSISNHAWGSAIDMQIGSVLVPRGSHHVVLGLSMLAPYFNQHGWYWGAAFSTPDPHHFECGAGLVESFHA